MNGYGTTKIALGNTVAITGNVSMPGYLFCAGLVSATGTKITSTGQVTWSSSLVSTGYYLITFTTSLPLGVNYIVTLAGQGTWINIRGSGYAPTSTTFQVASYQIGTLTLQNAPFNFMVLAS